MTKAYWELQRDGTTFWADAAAEVGSPAFFQHGLCGDSRQTTEVFPTDVPFRRVTMECRGHGRSEPGPLDRLGIATFTDDLAALIERTCAGPVVVGGISMGAAIALRLAVHRPELVRGLILARPAWITESAPPNMRPNAEVGALLASNVNNARERFLAGPTAADLRERAPDNLASLLGFFDRQPYEVTAALLTRIAADGPGIDADDLKRISVPSVIIGHERDAIHPLTYAEALAGLIPGAQLRIVTPKAVDKARYVADFQAAIREYLAGLGDSQQA